MIAAVESYLAVRRAAGFTLRARLKSLVILPTYAP